MIAFRDNYTREIGAELIVHQNREALDAGANPFVLGTQKCCGLLKTKSLLDALTEGGYDAAFGGARRDEEKSRAKERIYSFRDQYGQWDPKNQRPELWNIFNSRLIKGDSIRVFPLSNWTELDVWLYIRYMESIPIVPLYFARERPGSAARRGSIIVIHSEKELLTGEKLANGEVPDALAGLRAVHGRHPVRCGYGTGNHRRDAFVSPLGAGESRHRPRRRRFSMELKKREGYF